MLKVPKAQSGVSFWCILLLTLCHVSPRLLSPCQDSRRLKVGMAFLFALDIDLTSSRGSLPVQHQNWHSSQRTEMMQLVCDKHGFFSIECDAS